eukprot:TRINITY_DN10507_c0_g2_i8.p1 TRINITY_DN10507_c0_g2~~TRINITY_DN10507_c0_g2_i8.p1  ORF type:complete len:128 (-),score=44.04 TRINITY_DN10507_c0_g2_i8:69-452(-)
MCEQGLWQGCVFFFFSSRRRHTRCREVSWARRCVQETAIYSEPDFSSSPWKKITKEAIEFVRRLLIKDPEKRMTLREVLQHPWITRDIKEVREARRNSLPGNAFELFSLVKPDTTNLLKEIQKKQLK